MRKDFERALDDFLNERMGDEVVRLKERNEKYNAALSEYSELIENARNNKINDYRLVLDRLAELAAYIRDVEGRFLFYAGLAMHKKTDDAVLNILDSDMEIE